MKSKRGARTVRRSVALPRNLVDEVVALAPPEARRNLNRLVTIALREFADRRKAHRFKEAMARMAADPEIRGETAGISREFTICETDGLKDD
jgi:hypothetical protein